MSYADPPSWRRRFLRRLAISFSLLAATATALLALLLQTAAPVVLDVRPLLLLTGIVAGASLLAAGRSTAPQTGRAAILVTSAVCLVAAAAAAYDLTLTYRTEEVSFTNGDVTLRGTLYLPRAAGRYPAMILMHGSGLQPRDEYGFYARQYARSGVAALAYDKRGSGASMGNTRQSTYQMFAADAVKAIGLLRQRTDIDPARVGIWALSEGEWTGPPAAQQSGAAFLVLISVSARTPADQVAYEAGAQVRQAGFSEEAAREASDLYRRRSRFERTGQGRDALNAALKTARGQPWFTAARYLDESVPEYSRVLELEWFPAWRARMDFDAVPILSTLMCPVLVQNGGADPKTDGAGANERIRAALASGGNTAFTGLIYPNAAHNVVEWRLPLHLPPPFFARGYLEEQIDWCESRRVS
jgi:uncharacterized protein